MNKSKHYQMDLTENDFNKIETLRLITGLNKKQIIIRLLSNEYNKIMNNEDW